MKCIDHVNIVVSNLAEVTNFFIDVLGMEKVAEDTLQGKWIDNVVGLQDVQSDYVALEISGSATKLELVCYHHHLELEKNSGGDANNLGFRHMAFRVEDIESYYERVIDAGCSVFSDIEYYAPTKKKLFYFYGPEHIILEICEYE